MAEKRLKFGVGGVGSITRLKTPSWFEAGRAHAEIFELRQQSQSWLQQQSDVRKEAVGKADALKVEPATGDAE